MGHTTVVDVVERAYDLAGTEEDWLTGLLDVVTPLLDRGDGLLGWTFEADALSTPTSLVAHGCDPSFPNLVRIAHQFIRPDHLAASYRARPAHRTFSELLGSHEVLADDAHYGAEKVGSFHVATRLGTQPWKHPFGIIDGARVLGSTPSGAGVVICAPLRAQATSCESQARRWNCAMVHVAAALRLRRSLKAGANEEPEAVVSLDGKVEHATGPAREPDALAALRDAARRIDRCRGAARHEDTDAILDWEGLVQGRWTLVDRFDSDTRHYLVARPNSPEVAGPIALSKRERQVVGYAARGRSNKYVAYELGLSQSTISSHLKHALAKLRMDRAALSYLLSDSDGDRQESFDVGGDSFLVASWSSNELAMAALTASEQAVAELAISDRSNQEIAEARGTSARTVANQLAAIYMKLDVGGRNELAVRLVPG